MRDFPYVNMVLLIIILLYIIVTNCACSTSSDLSGRKKCREFENAIRKDWSFDQKSKVYQASLTFLDSLANYYADCVIKKDTSYMFKTFGRHHTVEAPIFGKLNKEYNLKITYEFNTTTKPGEKYGNVALCFGVDSLGVVRCVRTLGIGRSGS